MQRDMELIRKILYTIEERYVDTWLSSNEIEIDGYDMKTIGYHCAILHDAGLLADYEEQNADGFILFDNDNHEKPITLQMYRKRWKQGCKGVDMHHATAHILRHTYITDAEPPTDVKTLQAIAGHCNASITMNRYAHARKENVQKAAKDFEGMYGNVTQ